MWIIHKHVLATFIEYINQHLKLIRTKIENFLKIRTQVSQLKNERLKSR